MKYIIKAIQYTLGISGLLLGIFFWLCMMSSCSPKLTPRQVEIDYELEKAYLEYSYQRDSLIIEFYKK